MECNPPEDFAEATANPLPEVLISSEEHAEWAPEMTQKQNLLDGELNIEVWSSKQRYSDAPSGLSTEVSHLGEKYEPAPQRIEQIVVQRLSRKRVWLPIVCFVLVAAIVIPAAVVLSRNNKTEEASLSTDDSTEIVDQSQNSSVSVASTSGILNDTRLTVVNDYNGDDLLFYQLASGSIGFTFLTDEGFGDSFDLEISNAKNGTPLVGTSQLREDNSRWWWIFYVDNSNRVEALYSIEDPRNWTTGSIGVYDLRVSDRPEIAFAIGHRQYDTATDDPDGNFSFFICTEDDVIQEYILNVTSFGWRAGFTLPRQDCSFASVAERQNATYLFTQGHDDGGVQVWVREHESDTDDYVEQDPLDITARGGLCTGADYIAFQKQDGSIGGRMFETINSREGFTIDRRTDIRRSSLGCRYSQRMVSYLTEDGTILGATNNESAGSSFDVRQDWIIEELVSV